MKIPTKLTPAWIESRQRPANRPKERQEGAVPGREGLVLRVETTGAVIALFRYSLQGKRAHVFFGKIEPGHSLADVYQEQLDAQAEVARGLYSKWERDRREQEAAKSQERKRAANAIT